MSSYTHRTAYEKRGRGRPKKGELIIKQLTVHDFDKIKPEKRVAYANESIRTANALYARYKRPYPNPLNIDEKDLLPEARACWDFIYSQRGYGDDEAHTKQTTVGGKTKTIESTDEIIFAFECYILWIKENNFVKGFTRPDGEQGIMPIIPNQSNFARWLGVPSSYISTAMSTSEDARAKYRRILADCLSEGAMVGAYQTASTIFTLKNMCDWADKYEDRSVNKADDLGVAEAEELMKQLGYTRERAKLVQPMIEGNADG